MGTKLTKQLTYDATAQEVARMLDDVTFREEVLARQRVARGSARIDGDHVTIEQVRSSQEMPSFARKLVGDEITIVQKETWTSPTGCDVELSIPGKPAAAVGTMELTESAGRTTETVRLDVTVRVPLVGGKVEGLVAGLLENALDVEQAVGREWLAR